MNSDERYLASEALFDILYDLELEDGVTKAVFYINDIGEFVDIFYESGADACLCVNGMGTLNMMNHVITAVLRQQMRLEEEKIW